MPSIAKTAIRLLTECGMTVSTCESLTGGLICATLVDVPGASKVVRGGLITYQTDTKTLLAGVDAGLIGQWGVVSAEVAQAMAEGARARLGTDIAISATGMASPGGADEPPAGTVYVGVSSAKGVRAVGLTLSGDRQSIRRQTVEAAIAAITEEIAR
ncbi:MAG: nicotinamide-nucleotide amidohydrolase family protein [Clostridia bacterium]|nr:nicotinamide-nucleotide amidohydrolase family protein [Clostridia bacterium]